MFSPSSAESTDIAGVIASFDVLLLPSPAETFGRVLIEAMACGVPIVASGGGGVPDIIRDGETGLLVPPAEVEPLARAIVELNRDPARAARMGEAGRRRALEHFLEDRATDRTEILYRAFLDGALD